MIEKTIKKHLSKRGTRTLLSLGSCRGYPEVAFFVRHFPNARIHCFEPDPRNLEHLAKFESDRCRIYPLAIADHDGTTRFFQSDLLDGKTPWSSSSSIHRPTGHLVRHKEVSFRPESITVGCTRLDTWAEKHGIDDVDLIWADVQGAEGDLVRGGTNTLRRTAYFYTESSLALALYDTQMLRPQLEEALPFFRKIFGDANDVLFENVDHHSAGDRRNRRGLSRVLDRFIRP